VSGYLEREISVSNAINFRAEHETSDEQAYFPITPNKYVNPAGWQYERYHYIVSKRYSQGLTNNAKSLSKEEEIKEEKWSNQLINAACLWNERNNETDNSQLKGKRTR